MIPALNYIWTCKKCGQEITGHYDETSGVGLFKLCPKCNNEMEARPIVHGGPYFRKHPWRRD